MPLLMLSHSKAYQLLTSAAFIPMPLQDTLEKEPRKKSHRQLSPVSHNLKPAEEN